MKLKPRTTYFNGHGRHVNIAGLAKCERIEGQRIFWSIQGDWYSEDGRRVSLRRKLDEGPYVFERILIKNGLLNIEKEDESKDARDWWIGIKT
jgi:hypothetical protein